MALSDVKVVPVALVEMEPFFQELPQYAEEQRAVLATAQALHRYLNEPSTLARIHAANAPGNSSALIQATFLEFARELGFVDESKGLFTAYETSGLRPDYFLRVGETGILLEVERGKTTINNMDLLDFWKCHLCEHANYLFLMVPRELRQNATGAGRKEYAFVKKRIGSFFVPRNYTNVRGACVFGY
jgi:hypothetical protein